MIVELHVQRGEGLITTIEQLRLMLEEHWIVLIRLE